jgi:hypothetical protein
VKTTYRELLVLKETLAELFRSKFIDLMHIIPIGTADYISGWEFNDQAGTFKIIWVSGGFTQTSFIDLVHLNRFNIATLATTPLVNPSNNQFANQARDFLIRVNQEEHAEEAKVTAEVDRKVEMRFQMHQRVKRQNTIPSFTQALTQLLPSLMTQESSSGTSTMSLTWW